ncbi:TRAP transporter small permease [Diaphorobacter sp. HDW4A]|uniref:TRAP transporter small permease n=1 Tax=Diaphorobacter sp. HDW4A TaxID=2714924 RepID=UPI001407F9B6|nr:TRAP transporter small permease [Diaphorobacter sp. HDW4A]QIL79971.1 TRAP transporter small permease [Diaphorobacter sp. HDW4A]
MTSNSQANIGSALESESEDSDVFSPAEDTPSRICRWISQLIVLGLIVMMGVEIVVRSLFGWSIQISNELGGYALVAISFLSLGSGQTLHAYHRVHFVEHKLGPVGRARLLFFFDIASLTVSLILLFEFIRFEWLTWNSGDVAATNLMTPLWIPRIALPIGAAVLCWALLRTVAADFRRLRAAQSQKES